MATATIKANYNRYNQNGGSWWTPYGGTELFAGLTGGGNLYKIIARFDLSDYLNYTINNITLNVYRYNDGQSASKTWGYGVASGITSNGYNHVEGTGSAFIFTALNAWKSISLEVNSVNALKAGNQYIFFWGDASGSYAGIRPLEYSSTAYAPYLTIDYSTFPSLSTPTLSAIPSPITSNTYGFSCSATNDSAGLVDSEDLCYELQISTNDGSTWGGNEPGDDSFIQSGQGTPSVTANLLSFLSLSVGQYYYNPTVKARMRARCLYSGTHYYSGYATSSTFAIDYRLGLSAPSSLSVSDSAPYEGQVGETYGITFTLGRPVTHNDYDDDGNVNALTYYVKYADGTTINSVTGTVNDSTKTTARYTIPSKGTETDDYITTIKAYAVDAEGQSSSYTSGVSFMIKRFRAPEVMITNIVRSAESAEVYIKVSNTGYGSEGQIYQNLYNMGGNGSITYDIGAGYINATLGAWVLLENHFTITGLAAGTQYELGVKVTNAEPVAGLLDRTSAAANEPIYEYVPTFAVLKDSNPGTGAANLTATRALIVGADYSVEVDDGCVAVANGIKVGASTVWHSGNDGTGSGMDADTLDGNHAAAFALATIVQVIYPVGSLYISTLATNPNTLLGFGTWVAFGAGKALVGLDAADTDFDTVEETGGAKTHTLAVSEIPPNLFTLSVAYTENAGTRTSSLVMMGRIGTTYYNANSVNWAAGGGAHNNLQPYIVVYMWKRTA
jgi:hypothetical protein